MADEMKQIPLGGVLLTVDFDFMKPKKSRDTARSRKHSHGMAPGHESRSASRVKSEPRGVKQKTTASLARRQEAFTSTSSGGHARVMPGSQNRKKGASL